MKLKKKIILITSIMIFMVLLISQKSFAKTIDKKFYSFYVPDYFEESYKNETDYSSNNEYDAYVGENYNYTNVRGYIYHSTYNYQPYTKTDLDGYIKNVKEYYNSSEYYTLNSVTGKLIELNGVKGYNVIYYVKDKSDGEVRVYDNYFLRSDYCDCDFYISCAPSFVNSSEYKKIASSLKIKDTVLKSRQIPFTDVASWDWYLEAVKYVYNNGMIKGLNDYTFGPNNKLTRGMIVTILYRMEGSPTVSGTSGFSDVKETEYYAKAVKWAKDKKIVSGYSGTTKFGPNDNILRQDLAGILRNYAKYKGKNVNVTSDLTKFKDYKKVDSYANASMQWAVGKKVITGNKDGTLNPKGNASRAEAASMLKKYCDNVGR